MMEEGDCYLFQAGCLFHAQRYYHLCLLPVFEARHIIDLPAGKRGFNGIEQENMAIPKTIEGKFGLVGQWNNW